MIPTKIKEYTQYDVPAGKYAKRFYQRRWRDDEELYFNVWEYDGRYEFEVCFETNNNYWVKNLCYGFEDGIALERLEELAVAVYKVHNNRNGHV